MEAKRAGEDTSRLRTWEQFTCQCMGPGERLVAHEASEEGSGHMWDPTCLDP